MVFDLRLIAATLDSLTPAQVVTLVLLAPVLILVHELGHAAVALRCTRDEPVIVAVRWHWTIFLPPVGRLRLVFSPLRGDLEAGGWCAAGTAQMHPRQLMAYAAAGPVASALAALVAAASTVPLHTMWAAIAWLAFAISTFGAVFNAIPGCGRDGDLFWIAFRVVRLVPEAEIQRFMRADEQTA